MCKVHPRSRGEYGVLRGDELNSIGSSPLTRGIREEWEKLNKAAGVHPRSCGEYETLWRG